jgi:hypothetical protein
VHGAPLHSMGVWLQGIEAAEGVRLPTSVYPSLFYLVFREPADTAFKAGLRSPKLHPVEFEV